MIGAHFAGTFKLSYTSSLIVLLLSTKAAIHGDNSVLLSIVSTVKNSLQARFKLFSDLPGFQASHGGVIPPHILVTNLKPDLFVDNEASRLVVIVEWSCSWDSNVESAHNFKQKYSPLMADLSFHYCVRYYPVEVSVRGQVTKGNKSCYKSFIFECCMEHRLKIIGC